MYCYFALVWGFRVLLVLMSLGILPILIEATPVSGPVKPFTYFSKVQHLLSKVFATRTCGFYPLMHSTMSNDHRGDLFPTQPEPLAENICSKDLPTSKTCHRDLSEGRTDNKESVPSGATKQAHPKLRSKPFSSFPKSKRRAPIQSAQAPVCHIPLSSDSNTLSEVSKHTPTPATSTDSKVLTSSILAGMHHSCTKPPRHPFTAFQLRSIATTYRHRRMVRFKPILNVGTQIPDRSHCLDRELLDIDDVQPSQLADVSSDLRFASSLVEEPAKFQSTSSAVLCVEDKIVTESETKGIVKSESIKTEAETTSGNLCKPVGEEIKQGEEKCVEGALMSQAASLEGDQSTKPDKKSKPKRDSPDAFVAVRISSPFIRGSLELIQKSLVEKNKKLKHALVSLDKLHITMMVIKLGVDEERIEKAKLALEEAARRVSVFLTSEKQSGPAPLTLVFKGVSSFSDQVLFASLDKTNELMMSQFTAVADIIRAAFCEAGIRSTDHKRFNPHLTIAKLSKLPSRKNLKYVRLHHKYFREFTDTFHGAVEVGGLELLSMTRKPETDDGYYYAFSRSNWVTDVKY